MFAFEGFPPSAEQVRGADQEGHQAGQGVAVPESADAQAQHHAQQQAQADAGEDAVQQCHREVQLRVAGAVDQGVVLGLGIRGFWYGNALSGLVPFLIGTAYLLSGRWKTYKGKNQVVLEEKEDLAD